MPMPYTRDALKALRHAATTNTSLSEIQQHLGWDTATIARRCKDHGIDLLIPLATALGAHDDVPPAPAALDLILSKLTPRHAQIFSVLQPHADGEWFSAASAARSDGCRLSGRDPDGRGRRLPACDGRGEAMTTAAAKQAAPDVAQLHARRHKWGDPVNIHRDTSASGCDETERPCALCGLVKITVHPPQGYPYRAFRTAGGIRFPDPSWTPICDGDSES